MCACSNRLCPPSEACEEHLQFEQNLLHNQAGCPIVRQPVTLRSNEECGPAGSLSIGLRCSFTIFETLQKWLCTNGTLACDSVRTPLTFDGRRFGQSQTSKQSKCDCCGVREAQDDVHHVAANSWADQYSDATLQAGAADFTTSSDFRQGQRRMFAVCTTKILERLQVPEERVA